MMGIVTLAADPFVAADICHWMNMPLLARWPGEYLEKVQAALEDEVSKHANGG